MSVYSINDHHYTGGMYGYDEWYYYKSNNTQNYYSWEDSRILTLVAGYSVLRSIVFGGVCVIVLNMNELY